MEVMETDSSAYIGAILMLASGAFIVHSVARIIEVACLQSVRKGFQRGYTRMTLNVVCFTSLALAIGKGLSDLGIFQPYFWSLIVVTIASSGITWEKAKLVIFPWEVTIRMSWVEKIPPIIGFIVGIVFSVVFALIFDWVDTKAGIAFVGIIIGGSIPASVAWLNSRENRKQRWALAALDKRLQVHQEAYTLWCQTFRLVYKKEELMELLPKAEKWWDNNCLFLDTKSRQAFRAHLFAVGIHNDLVEDSPRPWSKETLAELRANWGTMEQLGPMLAEGVNLTGDLEIHKKDPRKDEGLQG